MNKPLSAADFALSQEQKEQLFSSQVWPRLTRASVVNKTPSLTYIIGQPASGKSTLMNSLRKQMDFPPIMVDSDELRLLHPDIDAIMDAEPQRMDVLSNEPVGYWIGTALDVARDQGFPVFLENTLTNPQIVKETANRFKNSGFIISFAVVSTPEELSRMGIVTRYIKALERGVGYARWTQDLAHSNAYSAIIPGLAALDGVADHITVANRAGTCLYEGVDTKEAGRTVAEFRDRPLEEEVREQYKNDYVQALPTILSDGFLSQTTAPIIGKMTQDVEKLLSAEELPERHYELVETLKRLQRCGEITPTGSMDR